MTETTIKLAEAKGRLSELADRVERGETIIVTRRGQPVMRLSSPHDRVPVDRQMLRALTDRLPQQPVEAGEFLRRVRDDARY